MTKETQTGAKLRPIIFSTEMVQAILEGRKTQTRRVVKPQPGDHPNDDGYMSTVLERCPYGEPETVLWVREIWAHTNQLNLNFEDENYGYVYKADEQDWRQYEGWKWNSSLFMPFAAARIFLRIKSVRVERLQDISYEDAVHEGIYTDYPSETPVWSHDWKDYLGGESDLDAYGSFANLWKSINGPESWADNPWVWVVEFERITKE